MPRIKQSILPSDPLGRCQVERERKEIYRLSTPIWRWIQQGYAWRGPTLKTIMPYITLAFCYLLGASCLAHSQPSQRKHGCAFVGQKTPASAGLRSDTPQQQWIMGEWVGEFKVEDKDAYFRINFEKKPGDGVKAAFTLPVEEVTASVTQVTVDPARLHLELSYQTKRLMLDGQFKEGKVVGEVQQAGKRGTFQMVHLTSVAPKTLAQYEGSYQLDSDRYVSMGVSNDFEDHLVYFDSKSRRFGSLNALAETAYFSGPAVALDYPIDTSVTFIKNSRGEVIGLEWRDSGSARLRAKKVNPHEQEDVTFHNGDISLSGTLIMPASKGPHPAIVWIQGAGDKTRKAGFWPFFLVRHGIAVLTYDKRGCGQSTGNWRTSSFADLAGDVLAGIELLKARKEINSKRIGVWGISNGGWVVPLVSSRSKDVAFAICQVCSALPTYENIEYEVESDLREYGYSEAEISQGVALRRLLHQAILTNSGWDGLREAVMKAGDKKWFSLTRTAWLSELKMPPDEATLAGLRNPINFDPVPVWEKVTCPVLVLSAELDKSVPTRRSAPLLDEALQKAENKDYSIVILPKANHWLLEADTGYGSDFVQGRVKRFATGYLDTVTHWLQKQVELQ